MMVLECMGVAGGGVWQTIRDPDGSWQPRFVEVASQSQNGPSAGFSAIACAEVGEDVHAVCLAKDASLWHTIRHANGSWQLKFVAVQSAVQGGPPGGFVAVACAGVADELQLVGVGADGNLWHTIRDAGGNWNPNFGLVESESKGGPPGGFLAATCAGVAGELQLVGVGNDGALWHTIRHDNGGWEANFGLVESQSQGGPSAGFLAAGCAGVAGELQLVGVGKDGALWHTIRHAGGGWEANFGLVESQSQGGPPEGFTTVGCASVADELQLAGVGTAGSLWHTIRHANGSWQPSFGSVEGASAGAPAGFTSVGAAGGVDAAASWLLQFTSPNPAAPDGGGRPWGDGTAMAKRATEGTAPYDAGSRVTPMVGGDLALISIRETLELAISDAEGQAAIGALPGQRGHVYIADWQLNALRDLSSNQPWGNNPWNPSTKVQKDQTAIGFILRMMSAGIVVRLLLWMPTTLQRLFALKKHADEHWSIAAAVQDHNNTLMGLWKLPQPIGAVSLDLRTAAPVAASLHQKMIAVRVGHVNAAFCGGVDLAFTRRDFGLQGNLSIGAGDWQSGTTIPLSEKGWPQQQQLIGGYPGFPFMKDGQFPEDLPPNVYGAGNRHWHDHHLRLEGPIVATVEQQFAERWILDTNGRVYLFNRNSSIGGDNQVQLTSPACIAGGATPSVLPLPKALPVAPIGGATVQMWRTIPLRPGPVKGPLLRAEFTIMAGIANAVAQASSLITIWDQYFWSVPLARLLVARLNAVPTLKLIIVLPPYGVSEVSSELALRMEALQVLWHGLTLAARSRVLVYDMWALTPNIGVYVHAKAQTYDDMLLVCGSANMNRRSFECDAELDCAVLHRPTVMAHLAALYACISGQTWSNFAPGWLGRYWSEMAANHSRSLIPDPFFAPSVGEPKTPNGVPMPHTLGLGMRDLLDPTSIGPAVESNVCQFPACPGDPKAAGRLDEVTFLLERCYNGSSWPWRVPATSIAAAESEGEPVRVPRMTL
jgi:phosphatidylserine/phosphatidylglycerophosphate/cardiolipin synthase-like enzyme